MSPSVSRAIIAGTAQTWKKIPWNDPSARIIALNDAYALGFPRIDEHYELHPLDHMYFRPKDQIRVFEKDVPKGFFIRPEGHIEWLKQQAQTIPVWLQKEPPADWPVNAARYPLEAVEEVFGSDYWASGPSYEIAHLYLRGCRDFEIYGIHLSTEHEYREQRPQFENLLGRLLGVQVSRSIDKQRGLRIYEGHIRLVLPVESPILQHAWKYAFEPKPTAPVSPYAEELHRTKKAIGKLTKALVHWPVGKDKAAALDELDDLEVIEIDCQQQLQRAQGCGTLTAVLGGP